MGKISGVIITFNEEENISRCIRSLKRVADEIVVVDSFSTDRTVEIAESLGARVIKQKFLGYIEQKNFAMEQAHYKYVLHLDADEELSDEAIESILRIKDTVEAYDAYVFNRRTWLIDRFINHGDWYPDRKIRLWNKEKGQWGGYNPHDLVIMNKDATVKRLRGDILHYSFATWEDYLNQMTKFLIIKVNDLHARGKRGSVLGMIAGPVFTFVRSYFLKLGFLDGHYGYLIAKTSAFANFQKYMGLILKEKSGKEGGAS